MFDRYLPFQQGQVSPQLSAVFIILIIWSIIWKVIALWKSARAGQKVWFVALYLVNSVGILEIIYITMFQKNQPNILQKLKARKASHKAEKKE